MLTALILLPLLAALLLTFVPRELRFGIRLVALAVTLLDLVLAVILFVRFDAGLEGYQFTHLVPWVASLGIHYHVGVDGLNIGLVLLAAIVAFAATCVAQEIQTREKEFYILLLVMAGGILGAFASLDLFFFYCFHELALVPTFLMIGIWGRGEQKNYATFNITIYLSLGALIALVGLIALYLQVPAGERTFDIQRLTAHFQSSAMPAAAQRLIFPLLMFGFGILVSLWPFHTWAPLGYQAAPTATAMLHAGVLKKFGLYGLIRVALPLMPEGARAWLGVLAWLCLGNLLYVGWVAMRQRDLNLLIGNSSVAHMGFAFLGIASFSLIGVTGAVMVMIAHGFLAALTFGLSGYLYQQAGTLELKQLGGLLRRLPFVGTAMIMAMLAGCGVPGFANFVGEVLVLFGSWNAATLASPRWFVAAAAWGALIIGAVYMLRAVRQIFHGPLTERGSTLVETTLWRRTPFVLLLAVLLLLGCFPRLLTDKITPSVAALLSRAAPPAVRTATVERRGAGAPGTRVDLQHSALGIPPLGPATPTAERPKDTGPNAF